MIIDRLIDRIIQMKNPTVVGLDPRLEMIPKDILDKEFQIHGETLLGVAMAIFQFNAEIIDAIHDIVPAIKPQIAFYEQYGAEGIAAYIETIRHAKSKGMVVIGDVKRGDIGSTAEAYFHGHLGTVPVGDKRLTVYDTDFITINPYLGYDTFTEHLSVCLNDDKGVFVLIKTSNKGSGDIQDLKVGDKTVYETVGEHINGLSRQKKGKYGYSPICAVVGATFPEQAKRLRETMPDTFFLIPGYGAQGGTAADLPPFFDARGLGGIINNSRGITAAYQTERYKGHENHAQAARAAALDMRDDLTGYIKINV